MVCIMCGYTIVLSISGIKLMLLEVVFQNRFSIRLVHTYCYELCIKGLLGCAQY